MKKYNMKINPHIVTLIIFLFVSSVFTSTASINATILQQPNSSSNPKTSFPSLYLVSGNDFNSEKIIPLTRIKDLDKDSIIKVPGYIFPLINNNSVKPYPVVESGKVFKIASLGTPDHNFTIDSVYLAPILSQQPDGKVKSFGEPFLINPIKLDNGNTQDYGFVSNIPLGDYAINVIMKRDDKPLKGLFETRFQVVKPALIENNENIIKNEHNNSDKKVYHIVKYRTPIQISTNKNADEIDPLKMAREYYQSIRGNVPSDRVLNNIVYYYKHYFGLDFGKKGSRGIDQAGYSVHNCSDQKASGVTGKSECEEIDYDTILELEVDKKYRDAVDSLNTCNDGTKKDCNNVPLNGYDCNKTTCGFFKNGVCQNCIDRDKDGDVDYYDCEGSDDACQDQRCNDEFCLIDEKWNYISQASVVDPNKLQNTTSQALITPKTTTTDINKSTNLDGSAIGPREFAETMDGKTSKNTSGVNKFATTNNRTLGGGTTTDASTGGGTTTDASTGGGTTTDASTGGGDDKGSS